MATELEEEAGSLDAFLDRIGRELPPRALDEGVFRVRVHYGFMQGPNLPVVVEACRRAGVPIDEDDEPTYYLGRRLRVARSEIGMPSWRGKVFGFMTRNAPRVEDTYRIPSANVVELGVRVQV